MILRHSVTIQSRSATIGSEGERTYAYSTYLSNFECDIQPISASPEELRAWGIVDIAANAQAMWFPHDTRIVTLQRVVFGTSTYEIRNVNRWTIHDKALLVPVVGL